MAPRQVVLYLHLAQAALTGGDPVVRLERGNALVTAEQVRAWCGRPDTQITVKPVLDLDACTWSESDRVTGPIAEKVAVRDQTCVFPWCTRPARRCRPHEHPCDNDHAHPRTQNGVTWSSSTPGPMCGPAPTATSSSATPIGTLDISEDRPRLRHDGTRQPTGQDPSVAPARPPDT